MGKKGKGPKKKGGASSKSSVSLDVAEYITGRLEPLGESDPPSLALPIGTRVECLHLEGYNSEDGRKGPHIGTIAGHWMRCDHWPPNFRAPYLVLLDDGMVVYLHRADSDFINLSSIPPMEVKYTVGARVECKLEADGTRWFPGTILHTCVEWKNSLSVDTPPYVIRFDYGRERPFWGPQDRIRPTKIAFKKGADVPLRFRMGDRVDCLVDDKWEPGIVIKTWYKDSEDDSPENNINPYQVRLDNGEFVFAPIDDEYCIRKSFTKEKPLRFNDGDRVDCRIDGKWHPGVVMKTRYRDGNFYRPYQIRVDDGDVVYAPFDDDSCIRYSTSTPETPLRFNVGDRVECMVGLDDNDEEIWTTGTVLQQWYYREDEDCGGYVVPYEIQLDDGDLVSAPEDLDTCIRASIVPPVPLRFNEGDRVICKVEKEWLPGTILKCRHRDEDFDDGRIIPYQVRLDAGSGFKPRATGLVYAPVDDDAFIRLALAEPLTKVLPTTYKELHSKEYMKERFKEGVARIPVPSNNWKSPVESLPTPAPQPISPICNFAPESSNASSPICKGEYNGYLHVMCKMLIHNQKYDEAINMLANQISWIRLKLVSKPEEKEVVELRIDLSNSLLYLAEVHQATGTLNEMKHALDEALTLIETSQDRSRNHRLLNLTAKLATHAALTNDKYSALEYSEESIVLAREAMGDYDNFRLGLMLLQVGKLNLGCGNMDRGKMQMTEGINMLTRMYGSDNEDVQKAKGILQLIGATIGDNPPCASEAGSPISRESNEHWNR